MSRLEKLSVHSCLCTEHAFEKQKNVDANFDVPLITRVLERYFTGMLYSYSRNFFLKFILSFVETQEVCEVTFARCSCLLY